MRRRLGALLLVSGMLAAASADHAPAAAQGARAYRLGLLTQTQRSIDLTRSLTLPELARLGFAEGCDFVLEVRVGDAGAMPRLARDVVAAGPDAIIAISNVPIRGPGDLCALALKASAARSLLSPFRH
jgi:hypothetical protein